MSERYRCGSDKAVIQVQFLAGLLNELNTVFLAVEVEASGGPLSVFYRHKHPQGRIALLRLGAPQITRGEGEIGMRTLVYVLAASMTLSGLVGLALYNAGVSQPLTLFVVLMTGAFAGGLVGLARAGHEED